ncbi:hypothetical protein Tco_1255261 [Tanacetum coccineum]
MIDELSIVEIDKVTHTVETDMVKLMVEIECFGMSFDEFDKETESSDGLQPMQADLSCVHALNEPHLHEIHVVLNNHEANQCGSPLENDICCLDITISLNYFPIAYNTENFLGLVTKKRKPNFSITGQKSDPNSTIQGSFIYVVFIMYNSMLLFQESNISLFNIVLTLGQIPRKNRFVIQESSLRNMYVK